MGPTSTSLAYLETTRVSRSSTNVAKIIKRIKELFNANQGSINSIKCVSISHLLVN